MYWNALNNREITVVIMAKFTAVVRLMVATMETGTMETAEMGTMETATLEAEVSFWTVDSRSSLLVATETNFRLVCGRQS